MDDPVADRAPAPTERGRRFRTSLVAAGAALGMTLAGLGIAGAHTGEATGTAASERGDRVRALGHARHHGTALSAAAQAIGMSQEDLRTALRSGQSMAQVAESKGVAVQRVVDALVAEARSRLAAKVESGSLTQGEADRKAAALEARISEMVNRTGPAGPRPGGHGGPRRHHGVALSAAAQAIGMSEDDLRTALRSGQSMAQVAESKGVAVQRVVDALVAEARSRLAAKVESGSLTQAQADRMGASIEERVAAMVQRSGGRRGHDGPKAAPSGSGGPGRSGTTAG